MRFGSASSGSSSNKYLYNGKELQEETDWLDYGARMYDGQIGRFHTLDPRAEDYYSYSQYNYVGGNPIKRVDVNGEFWNYVFGAVVGAVAEYVGQVAANIAKDGDFQISDLYENIDYGDIGVSAVEGAVTSGGSVIKKAFVKGAVIVGAEVTRNAIDIKSDGVKVNSVKEVVKNTTIGLIVGSVGALTPKPKIKILNSTNPQKAVRKARKKGKITRKANNKIKQKARTKMKQVKMGNEAWSNILNEPVFSSGAEILKQKTSEEKK